MRNAARQKLFDYIEMYGQLQKQASEDRHDVARWV
tara:strand:+ start:411 stop:515 length:105 start_codon:yes stop_codon:yes gene_type:complete